MEGGSSNPTSCPPRRKTRGQEDKFWENYYIEHQKRKNEKRKNEEESSCYNNEDTVKSLEKNGSAIIDEKIGVEHTVSSSKRTKNAVKEPTSPMNGVSYEGDSWEKNGYVITKVVNPDNEGVKKGRGSPCKQPLDVEILTDSSSSGSESDDTTSEEEEEFSDEDYSVSSSESSDEESENDGDGKKKKVITYGDKRVKKARESDSVSEKVVMDGDESVEVEIESDSERDYVTKITLDANGEFQSARKIKRAHEKKGREDGEETKDGLFEMNRKKSGYHGCAEKAIRMNKDHKKNNDVEDVERFDPSEFFQKKDAMDVKSKKKEPKVSHEKSGRARMLDLMKVLVESINSTKEHNSQDYGLTRPALPLKFKLFEDPPPRVKTARELENESLFRDLELEWQAAMCDEINNTNSDVVEKDDKDVDIVDQTPAACCARGDHDTYLDEQIGIICQYCLTVILEIKYVMPPFYTPPPRRFNRRKEPEELQSLSVDPIRIRNLGRGAPNCAPRAQGTVWDLIPGVENELYPHQREGFEFMWNKIAGCIVMDEMKRPLTEGSGCIISHAPGTGKTRLTIIFLQTFLMMNPTCRPVVIAPKGMLLTWEAEFLKWKVNIPFHNMNKKELSENENAFASEKLGQVFSETVAMSVEFKRLVKLLSWGCVGGILGVSYQLFTKLVPDEEVKGIWGEMKNLLLNSPGLLVLDEGHTPRNNNSKIWKALSKVSTQRRIILSGTPFQNNLNELFNTLSLVNPELAHVIEPEIKVSMTSEPVGRRKKWKKLTCSIGDGGMLKKIRAMLDPLIHVHKGTILQQSLPGLRDTLVFLHPTELQKELLEASSKTPSIFRRIRQVSLVSVHPKLMSKAEVILPREIKSEEMESIGAGVKAQFVFKLIRLANALGERVLVFSQYIHPLEFIREQIKSQFSWNEGREVLYMDGQLDERQRQNSISSFNDETSEAKVLLASERACSEGINLVGASRVVLLDRAWNPSVEKQAVSRAYRLGQKKVVHVYRLFTSGTEVGQYARQIEKERMSKLLFFSTGDGEGGETTVEESEDDKILEAMLGNERFACIFEKIIRQPKESDLVEIFGLVDRH